MLVIGLLTLRAGTAQAASAAEISAQAKAAQEALRSASERQDPRGEGESGSSSRRS